MTKHSTHSLHNASYSARIAYAHMGKAQDMREAQHLDAEIQQHGQELDRSVCRVRARTWREWFDPEMGCWRRDICGPKQAQEIAARKAARAQARKQRVSQSELVSLAMRFNSRRK